MKEKVTVLVVPCGKSTRAQSAIRPIQICLFQRVGNRARMAEGGEGQVKGSAESHQALKKAVELRSLVIGKRELYGNREAWTSHQRLAATYRNILLTDLEFALDRKVEQELWNNCFKSQISNLQAAAKEKRNPKAGAEASLTLSWFLEMASSFYILMLQEVRQNFAIELPFFQSADPYGLWRPESKPSEPGPHDEKQPTKTSCIYLCQHCLVHLGDIARFLSWKHLQLIIHQSSV